MTEHVGFTGTRRGMTEKQQRQLYQLLVSLRPAYFHHGCCVGADAQAHAIAQSLGLRIVLHPPRDAKHIAHPLAGAWQKLPPLPYLERNHVMVDTCATMIAAPWERSEQQRSGTWATVRYSRKLGRVLHLLVP